MDISGAASADALVAGLPPHVVVSEVMITPTWNRAYVAEARRAGS